MPEKNYYKTLQIDPSAEPEVVQAAYRWLAQKYHPDANSSSDATLRLQELNEAYELLCDPVKRAAYDHRRADRKRQRTEGQHQAEYERQQTAQAAEQTRKQEAAQRSAEQRSRDNLRLTLAPGVTMDFVRVPAGKFLMGSTADNKWAHDHEKPQHTVEIPYDYWIGKYPVTNEQFARFVSASGYKFDQGQWQTKADHPVVGVWWRDAMAYCQWLNETLRGELKDLTLGLPTEAEWEKAARGTQGNEWPWGNEWDQNKCNSAEGSKGSTTPVGAYSPQGDSPYGAADMAGNVWEWCHSRWEPYPYQATDGRESELGDSGRVVRGGSWYYTQDYARCAHRGYDRPDSRSDYRGFRCLVFLGSRF